MAEPTITSSGDRAADAPVPLWRNRPFALFWVAQVLSNTGTRSALVLVSFRY